MKKNSVAKCLGVIVLGVLIPHISFAGMSADKLMSSYVIAKAEVVPEQSAMSETEMKAHPYTIQVASYINEKDALSHVDELKAQEKDAKYYPTFVRGQIWYKVCVGKFTTKEEAESYKKSFVKRTDEPFAVVISWLDRAKTPGEFRHETAPATASDDADKTEAPAKTEKVANKKRKPASDVNDEELKPVNAFNSEKDSAKHGMPKEVSSMAIEKMKSVKETTVAEPTIKLIPKVPAMSDNASDYYCLQVGAYPTEVQAKENASKITEGEVSFHQAQVKGQTWYRIYVGKFKSKKQAEEFQKKLAGRDSLIRKVSKSEAKVDRSSASVSDSTFTQ